MRSPKLASALSIACAMTIVAPQVAHAQTIHFGNDSSKWAKDGECDDPRFVGEGMTKTALLPQDTARDATDCRAAFERGTIRLGGGDDGLLEPVDRDTSYIDFGDDSGEFSRDGECDDRRFTGVGMTRTPLLDADVRADASDCREAYREGRIDLATS